MRILIINTFYYPNLQGGSEHSVKLLAESLSNKGHDVAVYAVDNKDNKSIESINGVKVFRYNSGPLKLYDFCYHKEKLSNMQKVQQKILTLKNKYIAKDFKEICDEFKPDIIHTNSIFGISNEVWKLAYDCKIPVIHTIRDTSIISPVSYENSTNFLIESAYNLYIRKITNYVEAVTAPSDYTLQTALNKGAFKGAKVKKRIFNSVKIDIKETTELVNDKKSRKGKHIIFMYAGRLIESKGIKQLLAAFCRTIGDCELVICGNGPLEKIVKVAACKDKRIRFCGKLTPIELKKIYIESDILIVPSVWEEPFGRVVIEGNQYGLPVIAACSGGIPEIIEAMHSGVMYDATNEKQLTHYLQKFLNRQIYKKYLNSIVDNIHIFDIEYQVEEFEKLYSAMIL